MDARGTRRGGETLRPPAGFTLLEVLIAMAITATVATLAFASLSRTLDSVEGLRAQGERITELNRAWGLLTRDLRHFVARPVRNEFGSQDPALFGGEVADQSLGFTRIGWYNTTGRPRSSMQRVRYIVEDDTLYRESYLVLDRTTESEPQRVALLDGVIAVEMRFLDPGIQIRADDLETEDWPEAWAIGGTAAGEAPPEAIELRLELEDWGEVRWLYELPRT
jgi:general secretion pathway protein J